MTILSLVVGPVSATTLSGTNTENLKGDTLTINESLINSGSLNFNLITGGSLHTQIGGSINAGRIENVQSFVSKGITVADSIYSPNSYFLFQVVKKEGVSDDPLYIPTLDDYDISEMTVNGDVNVGYMQIQGKGHIYGSITSQHKYTPEDLNAKIGAFKQAIKDHTDIKLDGNVDRGVVIFSSANYSPVVIEGDVNAFYVHASSNESAKAFASSSIYYGDTVVKGNINTAFLFLDNYKTFDKYADRLQVLGTVHATEDVVNNGAMNVNKLIVDGTFYNGNGTYSDGDTGELDDSYTPVDYVFAKINALDAKNIINGSNLLVESLVNTRDQIYNQNFGTIKVTNNWFVDSTINLSGGIIDEIYLGPDHNLGINNDYYVTGGVLKVGDLRGDSTIHLSENGKLETQIDSVFEDYDGVANPDGLNTISLGAQMPEEVRNTITDIFTIYVPGKVIENVMDRVTLAGGSIVISGFDVTETQRDDLTKAFKEAFLSGFTPQTNRTS